DVFSERSAAWPSTVKSAGQIQTETLPVFDTLNFLPGIQARDSGSPLMSIRGSGALGRVLGLFEGISLNLLDGTGAQRLLIPREILAEVSVLKGPSSTLYGSDAMGGAVAFQARKFERSTLRLGIGSFGQRNSLLVGAVGGGSSSSHQVSHFHEHLDGNYPFQMSRLNVSGDRVRNDMTLDRLVYLGDIQKDSVQVLPRLILAREIGSTPGPWDQAFPSAIQRWGALAGVTVAKKWGQGSKLSLRSSWINSESESNDFSTYINKSSRFQNSVSYLTDLSESVAAEVFLDSNLDSNRFTPEENNLRTQHGVETGLQLQWLLDSSWGLGWMVQPSVRYLALSGQWVHALGLIQETEDVRRWLLISEGFRQPSFGDRFTNVSFYKGNPSLQNERSFQAELGFKKRTRLWLEQEEWGASIFSTDYSNLFQTYNLSAGVTSVRNDPSASVVGYELDFGFKAGPSRFSTAISYLYSRSSLSARGLPLAPRLQAQAKYGVEIGTLTTELRAIHWSEMLDSDFTNGGFVELPFWTTMDLIFRTQPNSRGMKLSCGVLNLLDTPRELTATYPEPQRRLFATMEYQL
ncbi:MAG: TonB-dependent receptor plug domain-containing protein, partial [Bdellovibrionales bacterium]|nr:TonB-dependent receptor plug domain-containing protein [Bdellovibrionales bacterium]